MPELENTQEKKKNKIMKIRFLADRNQQMDALSLALQININSSLDSDSAFI